MGKKDRERFEKTGMVFRNGQLVSASPNSIVRKAIAFASRSQVVDQLRQALTEDQIDVLERTVAGRRPDKLRQALMSKTPGEMDKAIKKFQHEGKPVTVDTLCAEIKSTPGFLKMCERVGLDLAWFQNLAKERMEVHNL